MLSPLIAKKAQSEKRALRAIARALNLAGWLAISPFLQFFSKRLGEFSIFGYFLLAWPVEWALRGTIYFLFPDVDSHARGTSQTAFLGNLLVSELQSYLNPFTLWQSACQVAGILLNCGISSKAYSAPDAYQQRATYRLPFKGTWLALNGGVTEKTSHSWSILAQRFAYDFVIQMEEGKTFFGAGGQPSAFYCYGQEILSPGAGVVVQVKDGMKDYARAGDGRFDAWTTDIRGNYALIKHNDDEYSLLAHLKCGSLLVKKGDVVEAGQTIGRCGNSGSSTEPHLHFHFQSSPSFYFSVGLPIAFSQYAEKGAGGERNIETGYLARGFEYLPAGSPQTILT